MERASRAIDLPTLARRSAGACIVRAMPSGKKAAKAKSAPDKKNRPKAAPARKASRTAPRAAVRAAPTSAPAVDVALFDALSEGERADALRILTEDRRVASMAKVARYRVISAEPMALKAPHPLFNHRLARVVAYDYSSDRCVDALVDLDQALVANLQVTESQPALAREEEGLAVAIALSDDRVKRELGFGDEPQAALQYWSRREADLAFGRRSAAVLFGQLGARPSLVAVVDLVDRQIIDVVSAENW
jgi:hypothetical protein